MSQGFAVVLSREQEKEGCEKRNGKRAREQLQNLGARDAVVQADKDGVNLSGVTGVPAAALYLGLADRIRKGGVVWLQRGLSGEIYNNYMYVRVFSLLHRDEGFKGGWDEKLNDESTREPEGARDDKDGNFWGGKWLWGQDQKDFCRWQVAISIKPFVNRACHVSPSALLLLFQVRKLALSQRSAFGYDGFPRADDGSTFIEVAMKE